MRTPGQACSTEGRAVVCMYVQLVQAPHAPMAAHPAWRCCLPKAAAPQLLLLLLMILLAPPCVHLHDACDCGQSPTQGGRG